MYNPEVQRELTDLSRRFLKEPLGPEDGDARQKLEGLRRALVFHEWRYYVLNDPILSDFEYDLLYKQLEAVEEAHPDWITADSPTQRVSADLTSEFESVRHWVPMLSLANSYNADDLRDWDQQIKRLLKWENDRDIAYGVEPKFDGGSIALVYEEDQLVRAATRGNGVIGEEITANAKVIRSIPLKVPFSEKGVQRAELRGEVLIQLDAFRKINKDREQSGLPLFANARNTATGGLRMKDPREVAKRGLEAFIYTLSFAEDGEGSNLLEKFDTHIGSLEALRAWGFKVPDKLLKRCRNIEEVIQFVQGAESKRETYPYEIDGMVVKVDERKLQEQLGSTSHHPRWAMAYKFKAKQATSKLLKVEYQVGKIGSITPVAKIEPVQLAGVTVSSVSLHNEDFIVSKDLRLGDEVLVERAGDVIPYIVKAIEDVRDGSEQPIVFPRQCPVNDTDQPINLVREEGEAAWRCPTCVCGKQDLARIIFHVSKSAMDIDGLGKQIIERFWDLGWIRSIVDVYRLDYDKIAELEGFGKKSAENMRQSVEKAKQNPVSRLLHSLSIHHLGKRVAQLLAAEIEHVHDLADWDEEKFTAIRDVGPIVARNVRDWFSREENLNMLREMEALGVNMVPTEEDKPGSPVEDGVLSGKTILFTGTLQQMTRDEAKKRAVAAGAKSLSAVSSNLDILVVGEKAGSKLKKAEALGTVEIWTEAEFLERLAEVF